jgi:PAS domain-containing protein
MSAMDNFDIFTSLGPLHGSEEEVFPAGMAAHDANFSLSSFLESPVMDSSPDFPSFPEIPMKPDVYSMKDDQSLYGYQLESSAGVAQPASSVKLETPVSLAPQPAESPTRIPKGKSKTEKKSAKKSISRQERQEQRKIKHRMIDRKRRMREKHSIEELKDLVAIQPSEKPDKATVVAGAVRTIKDLQQQVAELEAQLARQSLASSPVLSPSQPPAAVASAIPFEAKNSPIASYKDYVALTAVLSGLGNSGVIAVVVGLQDFTIKDVNSAFESISGFSKKDLLGKKFSEEPLYGRHVHGQFPLKWTRPNDPHQALIPTASLADYTVSDFQQALDVVLKGVTQKLNSRHLTRDGKVVVESVHTLFLLRDLNSQPYAIMCISSPDQSRLVPIPPLSILPSLTPSSAPVVCQPDFDPFKYIRAPVAQPS